MDKKGFSYAQAKFLPRNYEFAPVTLSNCRVVSDREAQELAGMPQLKNTLQLLQRYDYIIRGMVLELTGWILRDKYEHELVTKTVELPLTWWDMFRDKYFPLWWLKWRPSRTATKTFTFEQQIRVCPHANVAWPDKRHLDFLTFENENPFVTINQTTPECLVHHVPMVLCFYSRGPGDPPGNGWTCRECTKEREGEATGKNGTDTNGDGDCMYCGPSLRHPPKESKEQEKLCPTCGVKESEPHADPRCYVRERR